MKKTEFERIELRFLQLLLIFGILLHLFFETFGLGDNFDFILDVPTSIRTRIWTSQRRPRAHWKCGVILHMN